ncbi:hypothetical protein ACHAXR_003083, partial [Thalassiosira sp. AJA248-18]
MPFLTRNPSYYLTALQEESTNPLHIGLYLGENAHQDEDEQVELTILAEQSWVQLATAIRETSRSIRCLWLRVKNEGGNDLTDTSLAAFRTLGQGLVGDSAIESLVLEDQGVGMDQLMCLREYLARNTTLRGIKFLHTNLDAPSSLLLNGFLVGNSALRVVDLTANPRVDDETVRVILGAIMQNSGCRLETLNIFEKLEGEADANIGITESGVGFIASFVSKTPSLSILRLRIRELSDTGLGQLANFIGREDCQITRLEICESSYYHPFHFIYIIALTNFVAAGGIFGDEGIIHIAEALATNRSLRTIDIGTSDGLTDQGGQAILQVVQGQDESWQCKTASNHILQHVYISDKAGSSMSKNLLTKLQTITNVNPHQTLQNKAWNYIDNNIGDLSATNLDAKLAPHLLSFVSSRGGVNSLFRFMHSSIHVPELFSNPTPERVRLTPQMEKVKQQNKALRALLRSEREASQSIRSENIHLRDLDEEEEHQRKAIARCLLLPLFKAFE